MTNISYIPENDYNLISNLPNIFWYETIGERSSKLWKCKFHKNSCVICEISQEYSKICEFSQNFCEICEISQEYSKNWEISDNY